MRCYRDSVNLLWLLKGQFSISVCNPLRCALQLLRMFFRQQEELRRLKDELAQKDIKIRQLELELNNLRNSPNINNNNNSSNGSSI